MGFGLVFEGGFVGHSNGLCGCPVNRWSTKRPPNGTKFDRWSPGGILRPLDKPRSIPKTFDTRTRKKNKRGAPEEIGAPDWKTDNKENARMHERNTYANAMHMMT